MLNKRFANVMVLLFISVLIGGASGFVVYSLWDLPEVSTLEEFKPNITTRIYSDSNELLAEFFVENRIPVKLQDVPEMLIKALLATEDVRFYEHHGLDSRGIVRAIYRNLKAGRIVEGGSTLTQQLAKVLFLTPERKYSRKLKEILLALKIEQQYTKQEILDLYLNQIYFGSGAYGVEAAAQTYFGKRARELSLAECALLAGLPRSPKYYSPFRSSENAFKRRAYILKRMVSTGVITQAEAEEANRIPLPFQPATHLQKLWRAPYFIEYIRQKIEDRFGSGILYSGGLNIYTSINTTLQQHAETAVQAGLKKLETEFSKQKVQGKTPLHPLQAALIAIDPSTGRVLAMVGGRDFTASQFNRALQAYRQPGSSFKPIIYAAAIEHGFSPADIISDTPLKIKIDNKKDWMPENFTKTYQGDVTIRKALVQSLNVPTVRLLSSVGIQEVINISRKLGIKSALKSVPSLALGSSDITLMELTSAYSVFANHGVKNAPAAILKVTDNKGQILYINDSIPMQAIKPETAYIITNLLKGVIENGTGWRARDIGRPVAGKTGTTNEYRDAWFIGYTPVLVAGVWVGYDDQRSLGPKATGARAALPIWLNFMKAAHADIPSSDFSVPDGILFRNIDPNTGLLSTTRCRSSFSEAFVAGTEPRKYCEEQEPTHDNYIQMQDEAPEE